VAILVEAAAAAAGRGWPAPRPLSEPVAAAQAILDMADIPAQARLVVLDLGGGTVDATVVDRDGDNLSVVGQPQGRDGIGGEDYDGRLARWMVSEVGAPGLYDSLASSDDPERRERAVEIRTDARNVKEQLSRQAVVPAQLPESPPELPELMPVMVSRPQLEALICGGPGHEPGLAESVEVVSSVLGPVPPGPRFVGVFLTGGCSRIPMLGALVQERVGRPPLTYGDPTTAVALGAAQFGWKRLVAPPPPPPPPPGPPTDATIPAPVPPPDPEPDRATQRRKQLRRLAILAGSIFAVAGAVTGIALGLTGGTSPPPVSPPSTAPPSTTAPPISTSPSTTAPVTTPSTTAPPATAAPLSFSFADASQYPCNDEGNLHSASDGPNASFAFINNTSEPLQIIWLDGSGNRQTEDTLPGNETFTDNIRADEAWMIADSSSDCLAIFGVNGSGQITINP
jgi:Hsp70 protein